MAASTCTPPCCRAGAARRRSSAPSWPAMRDTGVTIMQMDEGLDTGPMLLQRPLVISAVHTGGSLHDELSIIGAEALLKVLDRACARGRSPPRPSQPKASRTRPRSRRPRRASTGPRQAGQIERQVRAFNPWPVAETLLDGSSCASIQRANVARSAGEDDAKSAEPGTILRVRGRFHSPSAAAWGCCGSPRSSSPDAGRSARAISRTAVRCRAPPWLGLPGRRAPRRWRPPRAPSRRSRPAGSPPMRRSPRPSQRPERAAVRAITLGTLRWYLRLAPALEPLFSRPASVSSPLRSLLAAAAHQVEYSRNAPQSSPCTRRSMRCGCSESPRQQD